MCGMQVLSGTTKIYKPHTGKIIRHLRTHHDTEHGKFIERVEDIL